MWCAVYIQLLLVQLNFMYEISRHIQSKFLAVVAQHYDIEGHSDIAFTELHTLPLL